MITSPGSSRSKKYGESEVVRLRCYPLISAEDFKGALQSGKATSEGIGGRVLGRLSKLNKASLDKSTAAMITCPCVGRVKVVGDSSTICQRQGVASLGDSVSSLQVLVVAAGGGKEKGRCEDDSMFFEVVRMVQDPLGRSATVYDSFVTVVMPVNGTYHFRAERFSRSITPVTRIASGNILVTAGSPSSRLLDCLDSVVDWYVWMWGSASGAVTKELDDVLDDEQMQQRVYSCWTTELQIALVDLLETIETLQHHLEEIFQMLRASFDISVLGSLGGSMDDLFLDRTMRNTHKAVDDALSDHSATAIGQIQGIVFELQHVVGAGSVFGMTVFPKSSVVAFQNAADRFEQARFRASSLENRSKLLHLLSQLVVFAQEFASIDTNKTFLDVWSLHKVTIHAQLETEKVCSSAAFRAVLSEAARRCSNDNNNSMSTSSPIVPERVQFIGIDFAADSTEKGQETRDSAVVRWMETFVGDALIIGQVSSLYSLLRCSESNEGALQQAWTIVNNLMYSSLPCITMGDRSESLCSLVHRQRAALDLYSDRFFLSEDDDETLTDDAPESSFPVLRMDDGGIRRRRTKIREAARIIRKITTPTPETGKRQNLSLRANSFTPEEATKLWNNHHTHDNWLGISLCRVWEIGRSAGKFFILELWNDESNEVLAADACHVSGSSVYVCTRYSNDKYKRWNPGYLLAFISAQWLREHGFRCWDLGGTNSSPSFSYKCTLADKMPQSLFLCFFKSIRTLTPKEIPWKRNAILIGQIRPEHLWGFEKLDLHKKSKS